MSIIARYGFSEYFIVNCNYSISSYNDCVVCHLNVGWHILGIGKPFFIRDCFLLGDKPCNFIDWQRVWITLINAFNYVYFVWNIKTITSLISSYKPGIAKDMDEIISTGDVETIFPACEKISIDFAVMEPASKEGKVFTHPADFGWSDLGNWASLHDKLPKDSDSNAAVGQVSFHDCKDCIVHAEDARKVVLQGLEGYIVSEKNGCILVCRRSEEQRIREFSK